jgi:hypothetical protein
MKIIHNIIITIFCKLKLKIISTKCFEINIIFIKNNKYKMYGRLFFN